MKRKGKNDMVMRLLGALMLCSLFFCGCGKAKATTIQLVKTQGTVAVADEKGKDLDPMENLMLYSGYDMGTRAASYAWINLDHAKLTKMDENSEIEIQKDGKQLEILVNSGSLFFHVKEPLKEEESLDIRTSTMAVGIRGTCGWVEKKDENHSRVYLLEGKVEVADAKGEGATLVSAGQMAEAVLDESGEIQMTVTEFSREQLPSFVLDEIGNDESLTAQLPATLEPEEGREQEEAGEPGEGEEQEEGGEPEAAEGEETDNEGEEGEEAEPDGVNFAGEYLVNSDEYGFFVMIYHNGGGAYTIRWDGMGIWPKEFAGMLEDNAVHFTWEDGEPMVITKEGNQLTITGSEAYIRSQEENGLIRFDGTYTEMFFDGTEYQVARPE